MSSSKGNIYFFDSDVLIAAKNLYYAPCYAEIFWSWLLDGVNHGMFRTAINVKTELLNGNDGDYLIQIAKDDKFIDFWCETGTAEIMIEYGKLQNWANTQWIGNKRTTKTNAQLSVALTTFATGKIADPWLVSLAAYTQAAKNIKTYIVTNEVSAINSTREIKLPDAAFSQGVDVIRLPDLLRLHSGHNFKFTSIE